MSGTLAEAAAGTFGKLKPKRGATRSPRLEFIADLAVAGLFVTLTGWTNALVCTVGRSLH